SPAQIYGDANLIFIRYHAQIETKPNGHKKIGGTRPAFSKIKEQINYGPNSGKYYSLLMGREFKPGRWSILLDFDNKSDDATHSGLDLAKKLNMDQYDAPQTEDSLQGTPLRILRRCPAKGAYHLTHDHNVSGRRV
ncbi:MAG: hypothetical protein ACKPKO_32415, partial [Candidatus Fonsibacter sp.]